MDFLLHKPPLPRSALFLTKNPGLHLANPGLQISSSQTSVCRLRSAQTGPQHFFEKKHNFTLSVNVVDDGHHRSSQTSPGNITQNETTRAELNASELNALGVDDFYEADSEEQLIAGLLNEVGERFGQGEWIWTVVARDADPDPLVEGLPDPDAGNDWVLTITIQIMVPVLTEVAYE